MPLVKTRGAPLTTSVDNFAEATDLLLKDFSKMVLADKIDTAARVNALIKSLDSIDKKIKDLVKEKRHGEDKWEVLGRAFKACGAAFTTTRLDGKALKEDRPEIYERYTLNETRERITFEIR